MLAVVARMLAVMLVLLVVDMGLVLWCWLSGEHACIAHDSPVPA
jgi:hypothetical protein